MTARRHFVLSLAAAAALPVAPTTRFRLSICSETFAGKDLAGMCEAARRTGYMGLEIDPSNLSDDPASLPPAARGEHRRRMADAGIDYVGLHSFLKAPKGLHLTTPDAATRKRSWEYFARLIDLNADLGDRPVMVLGSSRQRCTVDGAGPAEATARLTEGLARIAPAAEARNVSILVEPLAPHLCDVINTMAEAVAVAKAAASPAIASMFDTHNTTAERDPLPAVIRRHFAHIRHVHLNELDGRYPGSGKFAFRPVLETLRELHYAGWLSVEVFDYKPDGETVAREAAVYLKRLLMEKL